MKWGLASGALTATLALSMTFDPTTAEAFCGFYVGGDDSALRNDATMVVLMREGTTTVLSMRNAYQGPPEDFAMVVPVPTVIQEENVRTLPAEVFTRIDRLAAPRLVEYWEQDPCRPPLPRRSTARRRGRPTGMGSARMSSSSADLGVTVEAEFAVAEYDIVILSAEDSSGLDTWLRREGYHIPDSAETALRPYVAQGTKFFVAKVDVQRVQFQNGRAVLSPLRVHYQSQDFALPVRLGLVNNGGTQDLLVHILSREGRFETANYPNVFVPTNLEVGNSVRENFGAFYAALFDEVQRRNPGAVVTEYAWQAGSCDPCPGPTLTPSDILTFGADVAHSNATSPAPQDPLLQGLKPQGARPMPRRGRRVRRNLAQQYTLTRLHYRYGPQGVDEDLIFRRGSGAYGGRGTPDERGVMSHDVRISGERSQFQGRYAILHRWEGPVACENPRRGLWGGPPQGGNPQPRAALDLATQARSGNLASFFPSSSVPELPMLRSEADPSATRATSMSESTPPPADSTTPAAPPAAAPATAGSPMTEPADPAPEENAAVIDESTTCASGTRAPAFALFGMLAMLLVQRRRTR